jgi:SET domain-containing protein
MSDIIIKKSKVGQFSNGKGVFANRDFKKGEVVIKYNLEPLSKEEFENLPVSEKEFTHNHRSIIYLYSVPERYVNHSSNPNTIQDLKNKCDVAKRDIKKGEEITTDATKDEIS